MPASLKECHTSLCHILSNKYNEVRGCTEPLGPSANPSYARSGSWLTCHIGNPSLQIILKRRAVLRNLSFQEIETRPPDGELDGGPHLMFASRVIHSVRSLLYNIFDGYLSKKTRFVWLAKSGFGAGSAHPHPPPQIPILALLPWLIAIWRFGARTQGVPWL